MTTFNQTIILNSYLEQQISLIPTLLPLQVNHSTTAKSNTKFSLLWLTSIIDSIIYKTKLKLFSTHFKNP